MDEWEVFPREAVAVAMKAQEEGVARLETTEEEEFERAAAIIRAARDMTHTLMEAGFIPPAPGEPEAMEPVPA
jgi:malate dehydrogenase (oxaloacetate-decarboxylating)